MFSIRTMCTERAQVMVETTSATVLEVQGLQTHFHTRSGIVKAVDGVDLQVRAGEIVGLVGESGSGKSITGFSILGLIDPPGRIAGGSIRYLGQELLGLSEEKLRQLRGNQIAMIFQDPMMTLNPVLRIDTQMIETIQAHECRVSTQAARARSESPRPGRNSGPLRAATGLSPPAIGGYASAGGDRHCVAEPA